MFSELFIDPNVRLLELKAALKKAASSQENVNYWHVVGVIERIWERSRIPAKDLKEMMNDCSRPDSGSAVKHTYSEIQRYLNSMESRR
jgi:hypothetical protein